VLSDLDIAARLLVATALSGVIGLERERGERAAGLRTHALVGLGSCLVMVVSAFGFADWHYAPGALDPSRIAAQVVSGIGFLGAGVIIFQREREVVRGLTTAASIWVVAAIGLAVGGGMFVTAVVATGITLVILALLKPLERRLGSQRRSTRLGLEVDTGVLPVRAVVSSVQEVGLQVQSVQLRPSARANRQDLDLVYSGEAPADVFVELIEHLRTVPGVHRLTAVAANGSTSRRAAPAETS
jgi:putative Mg2+ transporter-C (MgtC) family protein